MPILSPKISFSNKPAVKTDTAIVMVYDDKKLLAGAKELDKKLGGLIAHQLGAHTKFKAEGGQTLSIALPAKADYLRVIVVGLGNKERSATRWSGLMPLH